MTASRPVRPRRWEPPPGSGAALTVFVLLMATAGRYGPHGDELYFQMLPLRWWYEDQPPLTVWLTHLGSWLGPDPRLQRLPAMLAAAAGALLAAQFPRLTGHGPAHQRAAAWAHATTTYPLIVGHVFMTSSLALLAWQAVTWLVLAAMTGRRHALPWAGAVAGVACWNKLLVLPLVGALAVSCLVCRRDLLRTRAAALGAIALTVIGGPQVLAQARNGWPMRQVSADLVTLNGSTNRVLVLPLLIAFVGPPLAASCWAGLRWSHGRSGPGWLLPAAVTLVAWNLLAPAQPYYAIGLLLCATSLGWGPLGNRGHGLWRRWRGIVAANAVVAAVVALPLLPASSPARLLNPVARDQAGWPDLVSQVDRAREGPGVAVVTDAYSLAGAIAHFRPDIAVASGHNALYPMGPPHVDEVLLVGERASSLQDQFRHCEAAGQLLPRDGANPFRLAGSPMVRCAGPRAGWDELWPRFRHLGG